MKGEVDTCSLLCAMRRREVERLLWRSQTGARLYDHAEIESLCRALLHAMDDHDEYEHSDRGTMPCTHTDCPVHDWNS